MFAGIGEMSARLGTVPLALVTLSLALMSPLTPHPVWISVPMYLSLLFLLRNTVLVNLLLPSLLVSRVNRGHLASLRAQALSSTAGPWERCTIPIEEDGYAIVLCCFC
jgi:hypothetical protein